MKVIIPMAGTGNRFIQKGYKDPKPLIKVGGKMIIEYILDMFDSEDEINFICNRRHIDETNMKKVLKNLRPDSDIKVIDNHKKGPVYTIMPFLDSINDDEEVMVCYCDNPFIWNKKDFLKNVSKKNMDGCILTHSGMHPHTLNSTKMAFLKIDNEDMLLEIKEKECYTGDPMSEHASTGAYYFKKGSYLKRAFKESIRRDLNHNGEYYVTLSYNVLVEDNMKIGYYDTDFVMVFGTPDEVENFEAWNVILNSGQVKNSQNLLSCYNYWLRYTNWGENEDNIS
jgi:NDP-sugar pyrophosphorylase family protein